MMGVIAGGGYVKLPTKPGYSGRLEFATSDTELREAIRSRGERLFNTNSRLTTFPNSERSPLLTFANTKLAKEVGNFARDLWVERIQTSHQWILKNDRYTWSLLEGFFERRGRLTRGFGYKQEHINISSHFHREANFVAELLVGVGIHNPKIREGGDGRPHHIKISAPEDIKLFAESIHSVIPQKETGLSFYRNKPPEAGMMQTETTENQGIMRKRYVPQSGSMRSPSDDEVVSEWIRVCKDIDHIPHIRELERLFREGKTQVSPRIYIYRFGEGSFKQAIKNLERLAEERSRGSTNVELKPSEEVQIFPSES